MSLLEGVATAFGLLSVWLTVKRHIACWPTGLVMVTLYALVFFQARLYSNAALQLVYFALSAYGWYYWLNGGQGQASAPIVRLGLAAAVSYGFIATLVALGLGYLTETRLHAQNAYLDALVTAYSLVAQWLLSRKNVTSWWFWIVVDVLAVGLFGSQGLWLTAGLYLVLGVMAMAGLLEWRRELQVQLGATAD